MENVHTNSPQQRLELEIVMLQQRLEAAEEMHRAIRGGEVDAFVVGLTDEERRIMLLDAAGPHYGQIVHRIQQGVVTVSGAGQILYANQRFAAMVGQQLAELFSAPLQRYIVEADHDRFEKFLSARVADLSVDLSFRRHDDATLLARLTQVSFGDEHATLLVTDLTSWERMEEAEGAVQAIRNGQIDGFVVGGDEVMLLGNAYHTYKVMVDRMQQGAVTVSPDADALYANDRFIAMVGIPRERLLGERLESFFLPGDHEALRRILEQAKAGGGQGEINIRRADGSALPVLMTGAPVDNAGAVTLMLTDLTEQRRHREIEKANRRKDEFLAVLAHELRNPLAPIRNAVQVLHWMPELASPVRQAVDIIARQSATLARLIDDLIDINRLNQGKITLQKSPLGLKAVIGSAVEAAQPFLQERQHALELDLPPNELYVEGDHVRLTQIVMNLLSNAAKFTPPGGRVRVVLRQQQGAAGEVRAVIRVVDTGIGIPAHLLHKIFEPYAQVGEYSHVLAGGLGLGLTVARRLVELHGGSITAHSEGTGQGSEFVVELPVSRALAMPAAAEEAAQPASTPSGMRVLVADDNADSAKSLAMMLNLSGYETRTALDGVEALRVAEEFRPHIALLDIGMPRLDGYATARELRARPWGQQLALCALTGWGQPEDQRRALDAGFDAHVVKPLDPHDLERLIMSLCRAPQESSIEP